MFVSCISGFGFFTRRISGEPLQEEFQEKENTWKRALNSLFENIIAAIVC